MNNQHTKGVSLRIKGKVQGVGFRPFVWQLAQRLALTGEVLNDGQGVLVHIAQPESVDEFIRLLQAETPPLARIDSVIASDYSWPQQPEQFQIVKSQATAMDTQVVPDAATCPDCLAELMDCCDRRYHYPFINCTHCGPRFTIINSLPYDRPKTVMADFPLCDACKAEYEDPADRRYHAQPVACAECGPQVTLTDNHGNPLAGDWLQHLTQALEQGKIIAIKSVGGFHLACDATNPDAVSLLRQRKQRRCKPFAVMVPNLDAIRPFALFNEHEQQALQSSAAPIVLLSAKPRSALAMSVAPNLNQIGIMLPSNPLHYLIADAFNKPVVMTSGNRTGLPPALDNQHALDELADSADLFVLHNREIVQRSDDSLIRFDAEGNQQTLRRSRGYVPDAFALPEGFPSADGFIAFGGDLKNAFAIGKGNQIIVSHYLGDLANIETQQQYHHAIEHYSNLYQVEFNHHVADIHPGYYSHQLAHRLSDKVTEVQHHHAHVASCLLENGWEPDQGKVLALALDGLGMGSDGTLWGAELLLADYRGFEVIGGIPAIPIAGGDSAARQPWMSLFAHLHSYYPDIEPIRLSRLFDDKPLGLLQNAMKSGIGCHQTRSAGRLFDAVAASLGLCFDGIEYEGQAACELEALANRAEQQKPDNNLAIPVNGLELDLSGFWDNWLENYATIEEKAWQFHYVLSQALAQIAVTAGKMFEIEHLVLTGGVFHNTLLTKLMKQATAKSITLLQHQRFSCGDGGLALGQIAVALCQTAKQQSD